ncbi:MAG: xanthine dehydrogenase family protein molybdopterin-binding subunit [Anaerolineae bacterium]|nr:xanthine dehydrogenase family protein molybdopterin-binding subunit [Anaerolineae bacterium]
MSDFTAVGQPRPIIDGKAKITGTAQYVPDLQLPRMLHARLVPSSYAHANILGIDTSDALAVPGVVAVLTHNDLPDIVPNSRSNLLLARGRVMFVGQPVAMVLATSETAAADGAERVMVEYEPLPVAITVEEALASDAPLVWPNGIPKGSGDAGEHGADVGGGEVTHEGEKATNIAQEGFYKRGDVAAGFAAADVIVERTYTSPMVHQSSLETHGIIAQPDPISGGMALWSSTQDPFGSRKEVAGVLGIPESLVRVKGAVIGGGFGAKFTLYDPLVAVAARAVGRPVRLALTRSEELMATNPAPPIRVDLKIGAKNDGTLTAIQAHVFVDAGCYPMSIAKFVGFQLGSYYPVANLDIQAIEALTFKQSTGAYRAPGAPTAFFALDTAIDEIAEKLDLDPIEVRLKNAARPGDLLADGDPWPGMGMRETLQRVQAHPLWKNRDQARAEGHGVGVAIGGWMGGTSPAAAVCNVNRDGMVQIHVGAMDISGSTTGFTLLAAEAFGVSPDKIQIVASDTENSPFATGTGGSKMTYTTGVAVVKAAEEARRQVLAIAAEEFEAAVEDLEIVDGNVQVRGTPTKSIPLGEIAGQGMKFDSDYPPVFAHGRTVITDQSPGFCAQLIEVDVDQETGEVKVLHHVTVQDVGRAINPMAVEGQMMGGSTQGLGWALYEKMTYDEDGQLLTGSWMDYAVPDSMQVAPKFEAIIVEVPSEHGPFGARGVGEPPVTPTAAAVANAIAHATGVRMTDLPMTAPTVLRTLHGQNGQS